MTFKENITAILECNFAGFKQEIIDNAVDCIMALSAEGDTVSRGTLEQIMWERDIAIQQLKDLGYSLGEKPKEGDLISRQAVLDMLENINAETEGVGFYYEHYVEYIKKLPSAENKGEWIFYDEEFYQQGRFAGSHHRIRECSICHHKIVDFVGNMNFCPNCGARMKGSAI